MALFQTVRSVSSARGVRRAQPVGLGLGGNVGDRAGQLRAAIALLGEHVGALRVSSLYESAAMLDAGAPDEWNMPFLNLAVVGETLLPPTALLRAIKGIEARLGRQSRGHWAPREIDIDILAYGAEVIRTPALAVPHMGLLERSFVLLPLAELWPDWRYPVSGAQEGVPLSDLAARIYPGGAADLRIVGRLERAA